MVLINNFLLYWIIVKSDICIHTLEHWIKQYRMIMRMTQLKIVMFVIGLDKYSIISNHYLSNLDSEVIWYCYWE